MSTHFDVTLSYCFEKKGVLQQVEDEDSVIPIINTSLYETLKRENTIHSGMLPKIHNCFEALKKGVAQVRIGNPKMITEKVKHTQLELK